jgi:hypothetical protein
MTSEEMERAIGFLLEHHAKVSADIERHTEQIGQLTVDVQTLTRTVAAQGEQAEADRAEIREAINNLIVANEVTRNLAERVGQLAIQTSQRVSDLESRPGGS